MKRRLLIVGAGNFGRELFCWAKAAESQADWYLGGFLDDRPAALEGFDLPIKILGDPAQFSYGENDRVVCAVADPKLKLQYCRDLTARGVHFESVIHPTAIVAHGARLGQGCVLCPYAVISCHVTLGNFVAVNNHATVGHDAVIGDGCTLSSHVDITGNTHVGEGVFFGSHASTVPGIAIGDYATVGAGSVAVRKVAGATSVFGVPAKTIFRT